MAPPPRWASKAEQHTWTDSLSATLLAQQPPAPPVLPAAERVWP
ncbi:MAG: hypothetical protein QM692_04550 [Thermomicrobiales bacterium]